MDYYFFFVFSKNLDNVNTPKWKRRAHKIREMPELKIETNAGLQVSSQPFLWILLQYWENNNGLTQIKVLLTVK